MLLLLITATAYFYYNWQYFCLVKDVQKISQSRTGYILLSFIINYGFFYVCSVLEFSLVLNWFLFAFFLFFETILYNRVDKRSALFCTLIGIIYGLTVNIFCRSVTAILMNEALLSFNNNVSSVGNLKRIPVFFAFFLTGIFIRYMRRPIFLKRLQLITEHPQHQSFLLEIMVGLFAYLCLNLLLYSTPLNDLLLKIWSIKSCLFSLIGLYIAIWYTKRICELDDYRHENKLLEQQLEEQKEEEKRLRQQASIDTLTGLFNRQYAEETLASMMGNGTSFTVCFLDLDGLKKVNDNYGHDEGDRYILAAAEEIRCVCRNAEDMLFRYGGDEFLILFSGITTEAAEKRAGIINERLMEAKAPAPNLFSLSYGVADSGSFSDWRELIREADRRMYEQKLKKRRSRVTKENASKDIGGGVR